MKTVYTVIVLALCTLTTAWPTCNNTTVNNCTSVDKYPRPSNATFSDIFYLNEGEYAKGSLYHNITIPDCVNVTLNTTFIRSLNYEQRLKFTKAANKSSEDLRTTCFPISENLIKCADKSYSSQSNYTTWKGLELQDIQTGINYTIGNYFVFEDESSNEKVVITCNSTKRPPQLCNYLNLTRDEYELEDNDTIKLPWKNGERLDFAEFTRTDDSAEAIRLCYPLNEEFRKCKKWKLEKYEVEPRDNKKLYDSTHFLLLDVDEYYFKQNGDPVICPIRSGYDYYKIHGVLYAISAFFLVLTFVSHLIAPELNQHAKPLMNFMFSLTMMYLWLTTRKFSNQSISIIPLCYTFFIFIHYFGLASFFWINVLAYDMFCVFNCMKEQIAKKNKFDAILCRFKKLNIIWYSAYAWITPLILTTLTLFLDKYPEFQEAVDLKINLQIRCWFDEKLTSYFLFYIPMAILILANIVLFSLTIYNFRKINEGTKKVNKNVNKQRLLVGMKLFVITGLVWIIEILERIIFEERDDIWFIPDLLPAVQGVIIFIIYMCKPSSLKIMKNKLAIFKDKIGISQSTRKPTPPTSSVSISNSSISKA